MSLTITDVEKIAHLARLELAEDKKADYVTRLSNILKMVEDMQKVDTTGIEPLAHSLGTTQRLRPDEVTEPNQREAFQSIAPAVEMGLYLVPKVIE